MQDYSLGRLRDSSGCCHFDGIQERLLSMVIIVRGTFIRATRYMGFAGQVRLVASYL